jgi:hypothetical protein
VSSQPNLADYLLPDGRRRGFRTSPFFCSSTASQLEREDGRYRSKVVADVGRYQIWDRWHRDRLNWASSRRLKAALLAGFAERLGERGRWLRVSQRGVTVAALARRWSSFARDHVRPEFGSFEWLRVTGITESGIPHVHVVWFGPYIPQAWLQTRWGDYTDGDGIAYCAIVKGEGHGVAKYLSRQFVEYLSGQGVRARWSSSKGWRHPEGLGGSKRRGAVLGADALRFVNSKAYRGHSGPLPVFYTDADGHLRSRLSLPALLAALS